MAKKKKQVKQPVARFTNKKGQLVLIYNKKGESKAQAITRVTSRHGVSPSAAK